MRERLLPHLCCPSCSSSLSLQADNVEGDEVVGGALTCGGCAKRYGIVNGVPRMNEAMSGLESVQDSFGFEWNAHHDGRFEDETLFGRTLEEDWRYFLDGLGIEDRHVAGATVLDGGCGSGRLTRQIGEHQAGLVVGIDLNDAVDGAHAACRDQPNVEIVQANIFALPFRAGTFDLVWSNGVIHHTPDARRGHRSLSSVVKPGGRLYVWVYPKRFNPFRFTKDVFDVLRLSKLPKPVLLMVVRVISLPSWALLQLYRAIRSIPGLRARSLRDLRTVRARNLREIQLTWFDALSPQYDSRHTEQEVVRWFEEEGFADIASLEEPKVGVRGEATAG